MTLHHIEFVKRAPLGNVTYNAGDKAAFEPHFAERLVRAGVARRFEPTTPAPDVKPDPAKGGK